MNLIPLYNDIGRKGYTIFKHYSCYSWLDPYVLCNATCTDRKDYTSHHTALHIVAPNIDVPEGCCSLRIL